MHLVLVERRHEPDNPRSRDRFNPKKRPRPGWPAARRAANRAFMIRLAASSLLALSLAAAVAAPAPAQRPAVPDLLGAPPLERRLQDWLLVCDNVRVCRAQATGNDGSLMIRRDPGPAGAILVVLDGQDPSGGPSIPMLDSIRVEGGAAPGGWRVDREGESAKLEGAAALAFVRARAPARALSYRAGAETRAVSLAGLTAALLAMDEAQGRDGTVTASIRPGPRPAAAVPPARPVPVLWVPRPPSGRVPPGFAAAVRRSQGAALRRADCEPDRRDADEAVLLSSSEVLVFLGCRLYNTSAGSLPFRAPRADPRRARVILLPRPPGSEGDYSGDHSNLEWDPQTAILSSGSHSCAGSCGSRSEWAFDGRAFRPAGHATYQWGGAELLDHYRVAVRVRR